MKKYSCIILVSALFILMVPLLTQASTVVLTDTSPDTSISSGDDTIVYGTAGVNHITLESGAKATLLNFPGNNIVTIQSDSSLFTVSRSGVYVAFEGADGTFLKVPATVLSQTITFNDVDLGLVINNDQVLLDGQNVDNFSFDSETQDNDIITFNYDPDSSIIADGITENMSFNLQGVKNNFGEVENISTIITTSVTNPDEINLLEFDDQSRPIFIKTAEGSLSFEYITSTEVSITATNPLGETEVFNIDILPSTNSTSSNITKFSSLVDLRGTWDFVPKSGYVKISCDDVSKVDAAEHRFINLAVDFKYTNDDINDTMTQTQKTMTVKYEPTMSSLLSNTYSYSNSFPTEFPSPEKWKEQCNKLAGQSYDKLTDVSSTTDDILDFLKYAVSCTATNPLPIFSMVILD